MSEENVQPVVPEEQNVTPEEVALPPLVPSPEPPAEVAPPPVVEPQVAASPAPPAETPPPPVAAQEAAAEATFGQPRGMRDLKPGMVLEGKVTSVAIYGVFVDIGVGREGLVPISQLSDQPVNSPTDVVQIGDMVSVRVVKVDPRSKRISLTMRAPAAERQIDASKLGALTPGTVIEGTVTSMTKFGAFVDIGVGRDGLIPLAQMAQGQAEPPAVGEKVRVRVMDVDKKTSRIRLSARNVHDSEQMAALKPGAIVRGKITSLAPFGAFVDLGVGKDGLIHVSTMGDGHVRHPREVLQMGEEVDVRVVEVDASTQRISLSMQLEAEEPEEAWAPPEEEEEQLPEGDATLADLAARFGQMRSGGRQEAVRGSVQAEREKRAVRDALRRTLEGTKDK